MTLTADILCKRFARFDVPGLTTWGPGAFVWQKGPHPRLVLLVPNSDSPGGFECVRLNVKGWGYEAGQHGWNGDLDHPTIDGSIPGATWHGWVRNGYLTLQNPG